jgi:tetratricopeptide (TPR) repeat protein
MIHPEHKKPIVSPRGRLMAKHWIQFLVAFLVLSIAAGQEEESPEVQLRAAMHMELVEGELRGAIDLYQRVASNPNAPRATVARALLQIGLCYEKLGDALADPAYQKLLDGDPEQRQEVEVARQRLAEMAKISATAAEMPTFQHIEMTARLYEPASLSPQGDQLAFTAVGCISSQLQTEKRCRCRWISRGSPPFLRIEDGSPLLQNPGPIGSKMVS